MQNAATWLAGNMQSAAGRTVTLKQGSTTLSLTGWLAMHEHELIAEGDFLTKVRSYDWTFKTEDLNGLQLRAGALVIEGDDKYEAMPVADRPAAEPLDTSGVITVLRTKQIR